MTKFLRFSDSIGIFFVCLGLFTIGLHNQEIIGFETRFYVFASEMWRHGPAWFPTTYGHYYPDYPGLPTFFIYLAAKLFGFLDKFVAVLPSATAAALGVTATYLIGALHSRRLGLLAACFMLLTNTFVFEARTISPDQYILMVTTFAFYCAYSAEIFQKNLRLIWLPILFLFGLACRGPIGFIVPAAVISVFYILEKDLRKFIIFLFVSLVTLLMGCGVLFYLAKLVGGEPFAKAVWHMQVAGRLEDATLPWYFYFSESFGAYALTYPIALASLIGFFAILFKKNLSSEAKFILKLLGWILVILIGLSIPAGKKIRYVLAMSPALALLCAGLFSFHVKSFYLTLLRRLVRVFCFLLPLVGMMIVGVAYFNLAHKNIPVPLLYFLSFAMFGLLQLLNVVVRRNDTKIFAVSAFSLVMIFMLVVEPINLYFNRARYFVTQVEFLRNSQQAGLVFYHEDLDGLPIKYMANLHKDIQPDFVGCNAILQKLQSRNIIVTSQQYFSTLPKEVLLKSKIIYFGNLGREAMVVFQGQ